MRRLAAAALAAAGVFVLSTGPAVADAVPFNDPSATGTLGFCDQSGHEVRSGDIGAAPFAVTTVSSVPAPDGYGSPQGRAALFVYQPIQYVDPGDWSGKQLTAASTFTNATHPMAQATVLDPAMVDFTSAFPPHWDGLVQLRMFFAAPNKPQFTSTYPAAVIRVSGHTWTLVNGGNVPCNAGKATSVETINLPASAFQHVKPRSTPTPSAANGKTGTSHPGGKGAASSAAGEQPGGDNPSGPAALTAASKKSQSGGYTTFWVLLATVAAGSVGWVLVQRRRAAA